MDNFVNKRGRCIHFAEISDFFRAKSRFFFKLAQGGAFNILALFKLSRGGFGRYPVKSITELLYKINIAVRVNRQNADRARVTNHLAHGFAPVRKKNCVFKKVYYNSVENLFGGKLFFNKFHNFTC